MHRISSAVEFVAETHPADLIFMDIDLPGINGMEAARYLRAQDPVTPLVFVTNLARYAVRGYQVDAVDFIIKPVEYDDFAMRMRRILHALERAARRSVAVATREGVRVIDEEDIVYVEVLRHDLHYHLASSREPLRIRGSLSSAESELGAGFVRISASCLVNVGHVVSVDGPSLGMDDGSTLFFSRARRHDALAELTRFLGAGA